MTILLTVGFFNPTGKAVLIVGGLTNHHAQGFGIVDANVRFDFRRIVGNFVVARIAIQA